MSLPRRHTTRRRRRSEATPDHHPTSEASSPSHHSSSSTNRPTAADASNGSSAADATNGSSAADASNRADTVLLNEQFGDASGHRATEHRGYPQRRFHLWCTYEEGFLVKPWPYPAHTLIQPVIMRLVFHDCVGGCDGCIDLSKGEHSGLRFGMTALQNACPGLSRADCWALAAVTTAQELNDAGVRFDLKHAGRRDCEGGNDIGDGPDTVDMPSAMLSTGNLLRFFASEFGFNAQETVALMGAHTLGSLANGRSGFDGVWVPQLRVLDNQYYRFLTDGSGGATTDYDQTNAGNTNGLFLWKRRDNIFQGRRPLVMLNVDMALVRDLSDHIVNQRTGEVSCVLDGQTDVCDVATDTLAHVVAYSNDNQLWLEDFRDVLNKMLANGYDTSRCTSGSLCVLP